ncbi:phospholipase A2 [Nakamurella leprariae]|uniref:Phospholipase A2 n=1 Tax=Nakamurella leprariae TaxID=2803911 RepID=A0A939BW50_9ACTN|nr:phospholipase A2 [Nakamurella leprariae]MBM9467183.1 hypothetical protein [Nakamurella leprariae]
MVRWFALLVAAAAAALWTVHITPEPDAPGDPAAQRALDAVTSAAFDPTRPDALFPADFAAVMGYRPQTATGPHGRTILIKPAGDCSSPTGPTAYDFEAVCKEHDLAYDLVRYAGRVGRPMPADARRQADAMFDRELHARCSEQPLGVWDAGVCHSLAESFAVMVEINSWRQGWYPPEPENLWVLARYLAFIPVFLAAGLLVDRQLRSALRRRRPWDPDLLPSPVIRRGPVLPWRRLTRLPSGLPAALSPPVPRGFRRSAATDDGS